MMERTAALIAAAIIGAILGNLSSKWAGKKWGIDGQLIVIALWCAFLIVSIKFL